MTNPIDNSYWVVPDVLLAGEYPGGGDMGRARRQLRRLLVGGLSQFIDLTTTGEHEPYENVLMEEADLVGVSAIYSSHPVRRHGIPRSPIQTTAVIREIAEAAEKGITTYLHGASGVGRVGLVVGCYLVQSGLPGDRALRKLAILYSAMEKSAWVPQIPETDQQVDYVRQWDPEA